MYRHISVLLRHSVLALSCIGIAACADQDHLGNASVTQLTIAPHNPTINIDFGDSCIIAPQFIQEGDTSLPINCTWSVGSYNPTTGAKGTLTEVAKGTRFSHFFTQGGNYYVHLNANNGSTGIARDYIVNVNRSFEKGILITAIDPDGNGNLSFVKTLTAEDSALGKVASLREHCLEILNPNIHTKGMLGASVVLSSADNSKKMLIALEDRCYFVNPNTFELIQTMRYEDIYPGFRASHFSALPSTANYPYVYDKKMRKYIHVERQFEYLYQHASYFYNHVAFEDIFTQTRPNYNGKDLYNPNVLYVNYTEGEVAEFSAYTGTAFHQKKSTGDLLKDQNILTVFRRKVSGAAPTYVLTQLKNQPTTLRLYTLIDATAGKYGNAADPYREIYTSSFIEQSDVPATVIPAQGTRMVEAAAINTVFYAVGGNLYSYFAFNTAPTLPTTPTLSFAGEEITALGINEISQELYVGTYNPTTQRGSLRVYDASEIRSDAKPKLHFANSTGRIVDLRYKP